MAHKTKLKVYRTPIGFHDAYVAAPSQKAALSAWGTDRNLFARGVAELVTAPELTAVPLAKPGEVIRLSRGTTAEQIAALPADKPKTKRTARSDMQQPKEKSARPKTPRPSREHLDKADRALVELRQRFEALGHALRARENALAKERRDLESREGREIERAEQSRAAAESEYQQALQAWMG